MVCPNCGATNDSTAAFCFNCGTRLEQPPVAEGSPTIRILPDEQPTVAPTLGPPSFGAPPPTSYSTQPFDTPKVDTSPFSVPPTQLPATPYSAQPFGTPTVVPNSTAAIISLVFGIVSWFALPLIGAIVAIVAGHMARGEIRRSGGAVGGRGMATAGLVLGYAHIAVLLIALCLFIVFFIGLAGLSVNQ